MHRGVVGFKHSNTRKSEVVSSYDIIRLIGGELKLPLTQISNSANLIQSNIDSKHEVLVQSFHLEQITHRMITLIDSILFADDIETSQAQLKLEPTNVASLSRAVLSELKGIARIYDKDLTLKSPHEVMPAAVDPKATKYIIFNLLDMLIRSSETDKEIKVYIKQSHENVRVCIKTKSSTLSTSAILKSIKNIGFNIQPIRGLPNSAGSQILVANSLTRAMNGNFVMSNNTNMCDISFDLPLSSQLELFSSAIR